MWTALDCDGDEGMCFGGTELQRSETRKHCQGSRAKECTHQGLTYEGVRLVQGASG